MKTTIFLISFILVAGLSPHANSIVDPAVMYQDIEKRIGEIKNSKAQISDALVSVNLAKDERKQLDEWKKSLDEEQGILEKRMELLRKLQGSGIITYVTPEEKTDEKGSLENLPNDGAGKKTTE